MEFRISKMKIGIKKYCFFKIKILNIYLDFGVFVYEQFLIAKKLECPYFDLLILGQTT